jgi:hypothetical protein
MCLQLTRNHLNLKVYFCNKGIQLTRTNFKGNCCYGQTSGLPDVGKKKSNVVVLATGIFSRELKTKIVSDSLTAHNTQSKAKELPIENCTHS